MPAGESLRSLFETLAQVSFAVTGLLLVVVASDADSRDRWLGTRARRNFIQGSLYLTLLPGFASIASLIPPFQPYVPTWPFAVGILGLFSGVYAVIVKRATAGDPEFSALESRYFKIGLPGTTLILLLVAILGYFAYRQNSGTRVQETILSITLSLEMILATMNATVLLNPVLDPEYDEESHDQDETDQSDKEDVAAQSINPERAPSQRDTKSPLPGLVFLFTLLNVLLALLLIKRSDNQTRTP